MTDRTASDRTASDRTASDRAASDRTASDRAASDRAASDRAASDRSDELLADLRQHNADAELGMMFDIDAIEELSEDHLVVRGACTQPGRAGTGGIGVVPGPVQMAMADGFGWILSVVRLPSGSDAYTIDMSMQFLRPLPVGPFVARCETLRWSPRRTVVTVALAPDGERDQDAPTSTFVTAAFVTHAAPGTAGG